MTRGLGLDPLARAGRCRACRSAIEQPVPVEI
jgi:hypothetical protein